MSLGGKWIEGIRPEGSVAEAARASLSARLAAVGHWLPLAAAAAGDDIEYVHQLRVSTRRAGAALRLYRDWLPGKPSRWLKKRLRDIRRAAGTARDLDVLTLRVRQELGEGGGALLEELAARRAAAQNAIVKIAERSRRDERLAGNVHKLLDGIRLGDAKNHRAQAPADFRHWAQQQLAHVASEFFAAAPQSDGDPTALHQFRIAAKKLRYAIELLAPAFGPELRREHYPMVEKLQERLGKINDHVAGAEQLREWSAETSSAENRKLLEQLAERDDAQLAKAIAAFREWWTPERVERLRRGLLCAGR